MRYVIKDFYIDGTIVHGIVDNAIKRNNHINTISKDIGIVACEFRPIYKSGEYGKSVVVTFDPLIVYKLSLIELMKHWKSQEKVFQEYVSGQVKE